MKHPSTSDTWLFAAAFWRIPTVRVERGYDNTDYRVTANAFEKLSPSTVSLQK